MIKLWMDSVFRVLEPYATQNLDQGLNSGRFIKIKCWGLYARTAQALAQALARDGAYSHLIEAGYRGMFHKIPRLDAASWVMLLAASQIRTLTK